MTGVRKITDPRVALQTRNGERGEACLQLLLGAEELTERWKSGGVLVRRSTGRDGTSTTLPIDMGEPPRSETTA